MTGCEKCMGELLSYAKKMQILPTEWAQVQRLDIKMI